MGECVLEWRKRETVGSTVPYHCDDTAIRTTATCGAIGNRDQDAEQSRQGSRLANH